VAGCVWRSREFLVVPEVDPALSGTDCDQFLQLLRGLSRIEGLGVIVSGAPTPTILGGVDRALELTEGLLTFDGSAADLLRQHGRNPDPADPGIAPNLGTASWVRAAPRDG
jgi:hypothetical protein